MNLVSTRRTVAVGLLSLVALLATPLTSSAAMNAYLELTLNGTTIEGDSTVTTLDRENKIECVSFSMAGFHDVSTAVPGRRSYRPITIRKRIDKSTPLLFQAWAQDQNTGEAFFRFYRPNPAGDGTTQHYYTVRLLNPQIVAMSTSTPDTLDAETALLPDLESVSFVFEAIEFIDEVNGTSYQDNP